MNRMKKNAAFEEKVLSSLRDGIGKNIQIF